MATQINWKQVEQKLAAFVKANNEEADDASLHFAELAAELGADAANEDEIQTLYGAKWATVGVQCGALKLTIAQ